MIVVAGESLIDLILDAGGRVTAVPGGGPYNTARAIARLGADVRYLGALSSDRFGRDLRNRLLADGVDLCHAVATNRPTTLALAELDDAGAAAYRFYVDGTSAPALDADDVEGVTEGIDALHVGTLGLVLAPMATSLASLVTRLSDDVLVMVDPNCRPAVIEDRAGYLTRLHDVLARADVVKVSGDDLGYLAPDHSQVDAARGLLDLGASVVLLTDGPNGTRVISADVDEVVPVPAVEVVDTIGAGDTFGGAFLAEWVRRGLGRANLGDGVALLEAVAFANRAAGTTCTRAGADPPTAADLASGLPVSS